MASVERKVNELLKKKSSAFVEKSNVKSEDLVGKFSSLQEKFDKMKETENLKTKEI